MFFLELGALMTQIMEFHSKNAKVIQEINIPWTLMEL
jgi:hypothetical protein